MPPIVLALLILIVSMSPVAGQDVERLYQDACDGGDVLACGMLGLMHETGDGVARDLPRAAELYGLACDGGDLGSCTNLALLHQVGVGVTQDLQRALVLYHRACDGGQTLACDRLEAWEQADPDAAGFDVRSAAAQIIDAETGRPLDGASVELLELGIRVASDESGRAELGTVAVGNYTLRVERAGYAALIGELEISTGGEFPIPLARLLSDESVANGRIIGRVTREDGGGGLPSVRITVRSRTEREVLSDAQGRFSVTDVESGLVELELRGLGYATRTETLVVPPGTTVEVAATMSPQPIELAPIDVVVSPMEVSLRSPYLERMGFYRRERLPGHRFTRDELELFQPRTLSDLLFRVPGVDVTYDPDADGARAHLLRGRTFVEPCFLEVYIDGVRTPIDIERIPMEWLGAVEIYRGVNGPIEYASGPCGAILLWTQR